MITINLHRWQPKSNRYRTQTVSLELDGVGFFDLVSGRGSESKNMIDPLLKQTISRTQQVDRIVVTPTFQDGSQGEPGALAFCSIDIYLSPFVERNYKPPQRTIASIRKKRPGETVCVCFHSDDVHSDSGLCLISGCKCRNYTPKAPLIIQSPETILRRDERQKKISPRLELSTD